nr:PAS domain-containing protein [Gemmatimonadales bacterium]
HEYRLRHRDGEYRWLLERGAPFHGPDGAFAGYVGSCVDITDRKAAEEQLRLALAASQAGVWSWDLVAGTVAWSPENFLLYGFDPSRGQPGQVEWESRLHPDDRWRVTQAVQDALEGRTAEYRSEFRVVHPERGVRWLIGLGRVERAPDGTPIRMSGINLDVTQRRETEARLQQAQRVQSVGRLAGGIAHEVNNLMTAVLGFGSFAIRELEPGHPATAEVEQMIRAGERAAAITRQLLAFTRQQVLRPARLELNAVVRELVPVLERLLGAEHQLVLRLGTGLGDVQADRGQLEQVLVNLALNSRDAMGSGGTVTVATEAAELEAPAVGRHPGIELRRGRYLLLSISDTGTGMDEATRSRVFEPFFTTKPVGQGTGLGLSTVYGIVKQSGGYVWIYSELGLGTTVKVYLPTSEVAAPAGEPAAPHGEVPGAQGELVLVAEDEPTVRGLTRRTLELHGYRVVEAVDGRAALELLEDLGGGVDLVLTDAVMPDLSGRALGEIIRARWPEIPVIYMSGYPGTEVVDRGLVSPHAPFVAKPFTPEAFARRTREVLDAARS